MNKEFSIPTYMACLSMFPADPESNLEKTNIVHGIALTVLCLSKVLSKQGVISVICEDLNQFHSSADLCGGWSKGYDRVRTLLMLFFSSVTKWPSSKMVQQQIGPVAKWSPSETVP